MNSSILLSKNRPYLQNKFSVGLLLLVAGLSLVDPLQAQTDDFDDGDDVGWERYDRTGTSTFSFPNGGYHIEGVYAGTAPLVFSTRSPLYTNFYAAVDLVGWDDNTITNARSAIGLAFRAAEIGPGTTKSLIAYWTPAINGGGARVFSIYYIWNDLPVAAVAATIVTLDPTNTYRMVVTGTGDFIEGTIYDLRDLTKPVTYISGHVDTLNLPNLPPSGKCGLFLFSRNNTTVNVTFDNYAAAELDPVAVPAPATPHPVPGTPQVVNRVPASNKNFHPSTNGISFMASTLGGNPIDPSAIRLTLNGADVSSSLVVTGSPNNRNVSYGGLASNQVYWARITLTETSGKSSTNDFHFDTFSESFVTNIAKIVEAEDYNYSNGQYQNDPPPSGFNSSQIQVNGPMPPYPATPTNFIGYLDGPGTPNVDYSDRRNSVEGGFNVYRINDRVGTFAGSLCQLTDGGATTVNTNDTALQKYSSLDLPDYQIHHTEGGEWLNYTRSFAPGRYIVYLRLSSFSPQDLLFDEVTSDRTVPGQSTVPVGKFPVSNTSHVSTYRYFPLVDALGNLKLLNWSGEKTFRLTMGGPQQDFTRFALQINYLLFVPVPIPPVVLVNPGRIGNTFSVSFASESGVTYTLLYKNSLSDESWIGSSSTTGDDTIKTLTDASGETARYYQVRAN